MRSINVLLSINGIVFALTLMTLISCGDSTNETDATTAAGDPAPNKTTDPVLNHIPAQHPLRMQ